MWNQLRWSTDGGRTWQGRSLPLLAGGFGILRDDTFVVFGGFLQNWTIRSTDYGQTWSDKVTLDRSPFTTGGGGWTWSPQRYRVRLAKVPGNSTYPTNAVLEDGTILTVCGKNHGNRAMAIRWRLPK